MIHKEVRQMTKTDKQIIDAILKSIIKALKDGVQKEKIIEYLEHFLS